MKKHVKTTVVIFLLLGVSLVSVQKAQASIGIVEIIKQAVIKVIKAIDLKMQRLQNKTIWLQNAQKTLENTLSKLKLDEIADWQEKQKEQYRKYYEELTKVKSAISTYQRIRDVTQRQFQMVEEYNRAWQLIRSDKNFTADEVTYMGKVYSGILQESLKNIGQISTVVQSFSTSISDAKRLELINEAADRVNRNYADLRRLNAQNGMLSIQRAKDQNEIERLRILYGIKN